MIKKFNQFIKENKDISKIISEEEMDDQFLRMVEVLNCHVFYLSEKEKCYPRFAKSDFVGVDIWYEISKEDYENFQTMCQEFISKHIEKEKKIFDELKEIKYRIENMFPVTMTLPSELFYEQEISNSRYMNRLWNYIVIKLK